MATDLAALTGPFIAQAQARGERPPVRLLDQDARGWSVLERGKEVLCVDEYGELWWGKPDRYGDIQVIRPVWPEEKSKLVEPLKVALDRLVKLPA